MSCSNFAENLGSSFRGFNILPAVIRTSIVDLGSLSRSIGMNLLYNEASFCLRSVVRAVHKIN